MPPFFIILAPAIAIYIFMAYALPLNVRKTLLGYPAWVMTVFWSLVVRFTLKGVLGSYGMFVTDIILYPLMLNAKKRTEMQQKLVAEGRLDPVTLKPIRKKRPQEG